MELQVPNCILFQNLFMGSAPTTVHSETPIHEVVTNAHVITSPIDSSFRPRLPLVKTGSLMEEYRGSNLKMEGNSAFGGSSSKLESSAELMNRLDDDVLEDIFQQCGGNVDKFLESLEQGASRIYSALSRETLEGMINKSLINNESKLQIAEMILQLNLRILRVIGKNQNYLFHMQNFMKLNSLQTDIIRYLAVKYPRNNQFFVPGELMRIFSQFSHSQKPDHDILRSSGCTFRSAIDAQLIRDIKLFINKLIDELDSNFPRFQRLLQEKVFTIQDGDKTKSVHYKIGRKLPQNTAKFTDFHSKSLDIRSPELFRVIIKWVEDMESLVLHPETVQEKETFKIASSIAGKVVHDEINAEDEGELVSSLTSKLEKEQQRYQKDMDGLIQRLHQFSNSLIKVLGSAELKRKYIEKYEAELIKFTSYQTKFLQWMLAEKLIILLKRLIEVGQSFNDSEHMLPLDLVKFNVTDLMRASMTGSKKELLAVYENINRLSAQGELTVVKIKNRLATSLNDAMVLFCIKGSFLICELQLVLADSTEGSNQKLKHIETMNHFFYELQRSPYGVLSELAVLMGYKDSRVSFADKISYENEIGLVFCESNHPKEISEIQEQMNPFICYECCQYYGRLQNIFIYQHCKACDKICCGRCLLKRDPNRFEVIRKKFITNHIDGITREIIEANRNRKDFNAAAIQTNVILDKFRPQLVYLKELPGVQGKSMSPNQLESYILSKLDHSEFFLLVQYNRNELQLTNLYLNLESRQLEVCFNPEQDFYKNKSIQFGDYDHLIFLKDGWDGAKKVTIPFEDLKKKIVVNIFSPKIELQKCLVTGLKLGDLGFFLLNAVEDKKTSQPTEINQENVLKKEFKYSSIEDYLAYLPDIKDAKNFLALSNLGLRTRHIDSFAGLAWKLQIKELRISNNSITDITPILNNLLSLRRLYATNNFIAKIAFQKKLPQLTVAVLSKNKITEIKLLENTPGLIRLNVNCNFLSQFPNVTLPELKFLVLSENKLTQKLFLQKCGFPNLLQLIMVDCFLPEHEDPQQSITIPFKFLTYLKISHARMKHISIASQRLERVQIVFGDIVSVSLNSSALIDVDLSFNEIEDFSSIFSVHSNYLERILLNSNKAMFMPKIDCPFLKILEIGENRLNDIKNLENSRISNLRELGLGNNQIKTLCKLDCPNLERIELGGNKFQSLDDFAACSYDKITVFTFSGSPEFLKLPSFNMKTLTQIMISDLDLEIFQGFISSELPALNDISLSSCRTKNFPALKFKSVKQLLISNFGIDDLSGLTKMELPSLEHLSCYSIEPYTKVEPDENGEIPEIFYSFPTVRFPYLKILQLSVCPIQNMDSLKASSISSIEEISIISCKLKSFPRLSLPKLNNLNVSSNQLNVLDQMFKSDFPVLKTLDLGSNGIAVLNNNKPKKPNNLCFKSLTSLILNYNDIEQLDITDAPFLTSIQIYYCKLASFPILVTPELTDIFFEGNPILSFDNLRLCKIPCLGQFSSTSSSEKQNLKDTVLPSLHFPKLINFSMSNLIYEDLSNLKHSNLPLLENFDMNSNNIKIIPVLSFPSLKNISLRENKITDFSGLCKSQLPVLESLDLATNQVSFISPFEALSLKSLNLSLNKLISLEQLKNCYLPALQSIDFSLNSELVIGEGMIFPENILSLQLSSIKSCDLCEISKLRLLERLICEDAKITKLPRFHAVKRLTELHLVNNAITDLNEFAEIDYFTLKELKIGKNKISFIPKLRCVELETLSFEENTITDVDKLFKDSYLPNITTLNLSNNKISSISRIPCPKVTYLILNNNLLTNADFLNTISGDNIIYDVNLGYNQIKKVIPLTIKTYSLNFEHNQIDSLDWLQKSNIPALSAVAVNHNCIKKLSRISDSCSNLFTILAHANPIASFEDFIKTNPKKVLYLGLLSLTMSDLVKAVQLRDKIRTSFPNFTLQVYNSNEQITELDY